jgi:hypothetical protein
MKNKYTIKITLYKICTRECILCGKTFSGEETAVWWRALIHVIFRHPRKVAECMWGIKEKSNRKDGDKNAR